MLATPGRRCLGETVQFVVDTKDEAVDPGTPPEPSSEEFPSRGGRGSTKDRVSGNGISVAFYGLIEKLMQQHQLELTTARARARFDVSTPTTDMERLVSCDSGRRSQVSQKDASLRSSGSEVSDFGKKGAALSQLNRSPTVAKMMCTTHAHMAQVNASKILDVFDEKLLQQEAFEEKENHHRLSTAKTQASLVTFDWSEMQKESWSTWCQTWMQSSRYEFFISIVLALNVLLMAVELEVAGITAGYSLQIYPTKIPHHRTWLDVLDVLNRIFAYFFISDVILRIAVLRRKFFQSCSNYVDIGVSFTSLMEVVLSSRDLPLSPVLFKLLRIGKLARAIRMISMTTMLLSLQLLIKCLTASVGMLFWSFLLLSLVQCVAGMILSTLCQDFITDPNVEAKVREEVFRYYGTFTRTFLSMFEILFANWSPACRVLVENVSEWFAVFFLAYRCVLGFAIINVVNSVFVQQTMKTASSDEDLAFRQKQKDIANYTRKVRKLFQTMDSGGDGTINLEEFSKLVTNPKLNFWMSQLELEYHDLMSLFEFLDNGDGEITLSEFIEGAARLRGQAKALDIWRMETKVEVLLEEVLNILRGPSLSTMIPTVTAPPEEVSMMPRRTQSVQDILENSVYKHIGSSMKHRDRAGSSSDAEPTNEI